MAGPKITDVNLLIQAGINPKTGLPYKFRDRSGKSTTLLESTRMLLRIIDEQRAVNRYKWYNLPAELSSQELERLLYYKGQLCFFYFKEIDKFMFMPYALDGTIDFYGRFNTIHPVPMTSGNEEDKKTGWYKDQLAVLSTKKLKVIKDLVLYEDEITDDLLLDSAVILRDYTNQLGQEQKPRYLVNDDLLNAMAECVCFMRSSLIISTGVTGLRVPDDDSYQDAENAGALMYQAAIDGNPYIPITSTMEFQELATKSGMKSAEFFLAMQSLDNLILEGYGIESGGIFEKTAHTTNQEQAINNAPVGLVFQDGLSVRQNFCNIVNSIWGLGIWCEPSEAATALDMNGDGVAIDEDPTGSQSGGADNGGEE